MKTTFDFNFDLYQAFKQYGYPKTWKQREAVSKKAFLFFLVNSKKACLQFKLKYKSCLHKNRLPLNKLSYLNF